MKILFLDIDGVLNCKGSVHRFGGGVGRGGIIGIDPYKVLLLDRIIQATGVKIVLCSTWRTRAEWRKEVKKGVDLYDITDQSREGFRGDEVASWMNAYPEVEKYAILDDGLDFYKDQPHFKTTWEEGLTEEISQKVIEYFNSP